VIAEVYVATYQGQGDAHATVALHAYDDDGRCKKVACEVEAMPTPNQTLVKAISLALSRLKKHGHKGTTVYTCLQAAVPNQSHITWPSTEGFRAMVGQLAAESAACGCEIAWCRAEHPRMAEVRMAARRAS